MERYGPPKEMWPRFKLDFPEARKWPVKLNIAETLVDEHVRSGRGGKPAVMVDDRKITYEELRLMVNRFGNALRGLGVEAGDRVMLILPNIPEFIVSSLAVQKIGAVTVPVHPMFRADEISHIANDCEAKILITSIQILDEVEKAQPNLKTVRHTVIAEAEQNEVKDVYISFNELIDRYEDATELQPVRLDQDEPVLLLYTSGTTGQPKGCIHTARHYLAVADCYAKNVLMASESDVWGGTPSLAFAYGHTGLLCNPLRHGATTSLMGSIKFYPAHVLELIEKHRVTVFYCVPTAYRAIVALKQERKKYDLSSVRVCVTAGEPCPPTLYNEVREFFGCEVLEHLGCTELLDGFISSRFGHVKPGSVGLPVPGFEVRLVDDVGNETPVGVVGHVAVIGPIGIRYWRSPDKQAESVKQGWNYTGDMAYRDEEGFFWFVGRSDDVIKSAAYRISPHEVEDALAKYPAVAEAAVIGVPDQERGQVVKAFIVLKQGFTASDALREAIRQFVKRRIAPYKAPKEIEFVGELPKTETGKIKRHLLRSMETERREGKPG
ncbi:MAG: acyl-CoA synthetase [Candidatus Caldarchaeum sp.]